MNKNWKIIIMLLVMLSAVCCLPFATYAQNDTGFGRFIPCDGRDTVDSCDFEDLIKLVDNVLKYLVLISFPLATITFSWAGFILLTSGGNPGKKDDAKKMMTKVVIGFAFILSAWLIVKTVAGVLLNDEIVNNLFK